MGNSLRNSSVIKVLRILEEVADHKDGVGITELESTLGINKSTIYRFVATLEEEGYLEQDQNTKKYRFGLGFFKLASHVVNQINWTSDIQPFLIQLKNRVQETVHLGIEDNGEVVYIDKVESDRSIRMYSKVGRRAPLYCTGVGKAILSFLPFESQKRIIENIQFKRFTPNTITKSATLLKEIEKIKTHGYALDMEEHEEGVNCAAAPIFDYKGEVLGAISIAGPSHRVNIKRLSELAVEVRQTADLISRRLGRV